MERSKNLYSIPNMLCYFRVAVIPVMLALFYIDTSWAVWTNVVLFALAGLSDLFDGIIARALGQTSVLGKILDYSADKMLVGVTLLLLVAFGRLTGPWIIPAVVIFLREILISGVREFMASYNVNIPVSRLGKWKLATQMFFMGFLIAGPYGETVLAYSQEIGKAGFLLAMVITVVSGWDYTRQAWAALATIDTDKKA